jgi:hypothetical protein
MRGLWESEQPLSPSLLRSAMSLLAGLLAALAIVSVLTGLGDLFLGRLGSALVKVAGGLAFPFAIWLGVRMLFDMLTLQHQTRDRLEAVTDAKPPSQPVAVAPAPTSPAAGRARDDGPTYPADD